MITEATETINFCLASVSRASNPIVLYMEFSSSPCAEVAFCGSSSSSPAATVSDTWNVASVAYCGLGSVDSSASYDRSTSVTQTVSTGLCIDKATMPGYEAWGHPWVTGDIGFHSYTKTSTAKVVWAGFYGPPEDPASGNATSAPARSWLIDPTSASQASCFSEIDANAYNLELPARSANQTFYIGDSGSITNCNVVTWSVGLYVSISDTSASIYLGYQGSYTNAVTSTNDFQVGITLPWEPTAHAFNVACVGNPQPGYGTVVDVWPST